MGDEVELTVRVVGKNGVGCTVLVVGCEDEAATSFMWPVELDAGRLRPRPIKVGDRVTWGAGQVDSEVIAIRGGEACLVDERWIGSGKPYTGLAARNFRVIPVSQLEKVS